MKKYPALTGSILGLVAGPVVVWAGVMIQAFAFEQVFLAMLLIAFLACAVVLGFACVRAFVTRSRFWWGFAGAFTVTSLITALVWPRAYMGIVAD